MNVFNIPEIALYILSFLEAPDILAFNSTCKTYFKYQPTKSLWRFLCQRDFGVKVLHPPDYFKRYQELYLTTCPNLRNGKRCSRSKLNSRICEGCLLLKLNEISGEDCQILLVEALDQFKTRNLITAEVYQNLINTPPQEAYLKLVEMSQDWFIPIDQVHLYLT